jgi:hypothetical protein
MDSETGGKPADGHLGNTRRDRLKTRITVLF